MKKTITVTIFTPTYNRAYIIENLYRSLQRQICHDFEWLVVDDGSADNTKALFEAWMKEENPFPIRYVFQENGGKHRAINRGLDLAEGELFFVVDSDDYLTDDAVEKVITWEASLPKDRKYCGVAGNLGTSSTETTNSLFEGTYLDGTALDRYDRIDGERAMVFYTEVHRKYPYPAFPNERFMTEAVVWNRMAADGYEMRFFNDIIWVFEYREDGLTKTGSRLFLENPRGYGLWLREKSEFLGEGWISRLKMYYTFTCGLSDRLCSKVIAEYIGAPYAVIAAVNVAHKIIHKTRK